jgi:GNAT superfamily N-acetyltransferase
MLKRYRIMGDLGEGEIEENARLLLESCGIDCPRGFVVLAAVRDLHDPDDLSVVGALVLEETCLPHFTEVRYAVHPDHRRRGLARWMLRCAVTYTQQLYGSFGVEIQANPSTDDGHAFAEAVRNDYHLSGVTWGGAL